MPQYGVLVYMPAPADPAALSPQYMESLDRYPTQVKELGAKVLGSSYFAKQRGFAFESSETATTVSADTMRRGPLVESDLVAAAFYVLSAPNLDVAVQAARLHPATHDGGVEVRPLVPPPAEAHARAPVRP